MFAVLLAIAAFPPQAPPPPQAPALPHCGCLDGRPCECARYGGACECGPRKATRPRFWWRAAVSPVVPPQAPDCHRPITTRARVFFPLPVQSLPLIPAGYGHHVNPSFAPMFGPACVGRA